MNYTEINAAATVLCRYCESNECDCCMVNKLVEDAYVEKEKESDE